MQNTSPHRLISLILTGMLPVAVAGCSGGSSTDHEQASSKESEVKHVPKTLLMENSSVATDNELEKLKDRTKSTEKMLEKLPAIKETDVIRGNRKAHMFCFPDVSLGELYSLSFNRFNSWRCVARQAVCVPADTPMGLNIAGQSAVVMLRTPSIFKKIPGKDFQSLTFSAPIDMASVMSRDDNDTPELMEEDIAKALQNLDGWTNLESISLSNFRLNQDALTALNKLKKLRSLTLIGCELLSHTLTKQSVFPKLKDLALLGSNSEVTPIIKCICTSSNLENLYVDNLISIDNLNNLQHCVSLESITILNGQIDDERITALCALKRLKRVCLSQTTLSEHQLLALTHCPWLKKIIVSRQTYEHISESLKAQDHRVTFL